MTRHISLSVNDQPIELDYFVQNFIDHTVGGILSALEGIGVVKSIDLSIEGDEVAINVNDSVVPTNPFVKRIVRNTVLGMLSSLKGVQKIDRVRISIVR